MKAAEKGHHDTMKLLIDNGADINLGNWVREWGRVANKRRGVWFWVGLGC